MERAACFQSVLYTSLRVPTKQGLLINVTFLSKSLVKLHPLHGPPTGLLWRELLCSRASGVFIHSYLSESLVKELSHETGETSPSTEPHLEERHTYDGVRSVCTRRSFMTLLLLRQCHVAFSMILSTLAWVDQSSVHQHVIVPLYRVSVPHLLLPPM
jgi:hypothetical protein